jgi:hypothetical protein
MFCGGKKARLTRKPSLNKQKIANAGIAVNAKGISRKGAKRNLTPRRKG